MSKRYKNVPILSHTHGQPASPSTMGKELINFQKRLMIQIDGLKEIKIKGKFNGATGNTLIVTSPCFKKFLSIDLTSLVKFSPS